jgi:hypothetical protein
MAREGLHRCRAYWLVLLVSVCVRVTEPAGVSTRVVSRVRDVSVACGAGAEGSTTVVELLAGGASRTVSLSFTTAGSFTTVVEDGTAERSQPQRVAAVSTAARTGSITFFLIEVSRDH